MNPVLAVLEKRGLISADAVDKFFNDWPFADVRLVQDELYDSLGQDATADHPASPLGDSFNFVASASMRGDYGCISWGCRLEKISLLARYSALYVDKIIVPLPLGIFYADEDEYEIRQLLGGTILCIQQLRSLVEADIVEFTRQEFQYCNQHLHLALPHHSNIAKAARDLCAENENLFKVYSQPPEFKGDDWPCFRIEGPTEFLEHGQIFKDLYEPPKWLPSWPRLKREKLLAKTTIRNSRLVSDLFDDIARDVAIQQVLGLKHGCEMPYKSTGRGNDTFQI